MSDQHRSEDALGMSDEDFSSLNIDTAFGEEARAVADSDDEARDPQNPGSDAEATPEGGGEGAEQTNSLTQEEESPEGQADGEEEDAGKQEEENEPADNAPDKEQEDPDKSDKGDDDSSDEDEDSDDDKEGEEEDTSDSDSTAAKAFFDRVTAPFKANGQEMQIKDPEDVVRLMQMGANYNKKMAALKPALKVVKMLERNKLMDEDRLSFLIDIEKKDPTAIAKLLKDSDLDPMDLDLEEGQNYKPSKKHSVDDREIELDNVIEDIKDSPTYSKTIDVVSNKWDDKSRNIVANTPELMRVIDDHMQSGVYEVISTEVEKERTLGRLNGIPAIEAYRQVGDRLYQEGAFDHLKKGNNNNEQPAQTQSKPTPAKPKPKADESERRAKRRAASPSKKAPTPSKTQDFNPLSMSDEDFEKQYDGRLL